MKFGKLINVRNIVCAALIAASAVTFYMTNRNENASEDTFIEREIITEKETSSLSPSVEKSGNNERIEPIKVTLSASIPELSCSSIRFDDENILFVDPAGNYAFIQEGTSSDELTVSDDLGHTVRLSNAGGMLSIRRDEVETDSFVFRRHLIQLVGTMLYYDSSPVKYKPTSFSAYRLTEKYTLECVERGKYRLRDDDGEIIYSCVLKESSGSSIKIYADDTGFYAEGVNDGLFYNVFKLNEHTFYTDWDYVVYIDGFEVVPVGYNDEFVNPDYKNRTPDAIIEPTNPPINYGDVNTENEGITPTTEEMLGYVNRIREQYGIQKLYGLQLLDSAALVRAAELADDYSHTRPDGSEYITAVNGNGLWWHSGECIANSTSDSALQVFETLICSEENRKILLDPKLKYLSAACENSNDRYYWELLLFNDTYVPDI